MNMLKPSARNLTLFLMLLARWAKRRVLMVSARLALAGLMLATIMVFELPPRESCTNIPSSNAETEPQAHFDISIHDTCLADYVG